MDGLGTNAIRRADDVNVYMQGSLGGGSVGVWICVSFWGSVFVAACFIYIQLTKLRSAQSDDNVFLECYCDLSVQYISSSLGLDVPSCVTLIRSSTLHLYTLSFGGENRSRHQSRAVMMLGVAMYIIMQGNDSS